MVGRVLAAAMVAVILMIKAVKIINYVGTSKTNIDMDPSH